MLAAEGCSSILLQKQLLLIELDLVKVLSSLLSSFEHGEPIATIAFEVLHELAYRLPNTFEAKIIEVIVEDPEGKFLTHLAARLQHTRTALRSHRARGRRDQLEPDVIEGVRVGIQTLNVMVELCQGNRTSTKELLGQQTMHSMSVDLLQEVLEIVKLLSVDHEQIVLLSSAETKLLGVCLELLVKSMQGPVPVNQRKVCADLSVLAGIANLLSASPSHITEALLIQLRSLAMLTIKTCLEGTKQPEIMTALREKIIPMVVVGYFEDTVAGVEKHLNSQNVLVDTQEERWNIYDGLGAAVSAKATFELLFKRHQHRGIESVPTKGSGGVGPPLIKDIQLETQRIATVEVDWKGQIEIVYFPLPPSAEYLTEKTKTKFLNMVDLETADRRMKGLLENMDSIMQESRSSFKWSRTSRFYRFMDGRVPSFKICLYAFILLLNLNCLLVDDERLNSPLKSVLKCPQKHSSEKLGGVFCPLDSEITLNLLIVLGLSIVIFVGFGMIAIFNSLTEIPMLHARTLKHVKKSYADPNVRASSFLDFAPLVRWGGALIFCVAFIIMHRLNANGPNETLYGCLLLLCAIWLVKALRDSVKVPFAASLRLATNIYDTLFGLPFLRNNLAIQLCVVLGLYDTQFYSLMLLDIINTSDELTDIIRSITAPGKSLLMVLYLMVATVIVYSTFGFRSLSNSFSTEDDLYLSATVNTTQYDMLLADDACTSVASCFWYIFYKGIQAGSLTDILTDINVNGDDYEGTTSTTFFKRFVFDVSFFIWVGILLFNIITGLVVDKFSELREEAARRTDILENECFVCALKRDDYDDLSLPADSPSFDIHCETDHNVWNYLFFMDFIMNKDPHTFDGVELFVWDQISHHSPSFGWVPTRSSHNIQMTASSASNGGEADRFALIEQKLDNLMTRAKAQK